MKRLAVLAVFATMSGCSTATMMGPKDQAEPLAHVARDKDGVCAHHPLSGSNDYIKACARQSETGTAIWFTELSTKMDSPLLDLGRWKVAVTRADGTVIFDANLKETYRSRVGCVYGVCFRTTRAIHELGTPWQGGRYDIRFTSLVDGNTRAMSITLR